MYHFLTYSEMEARVSSSCGLSKYISSLPLFIPQVNVQQFSMALLSVMRTEKDKSFHMHFSSHCVLLLAQEIHKL